MFLEHDLDLLLHQGPPLLVLHSSDEAQVLARLQALAGERALYAWSVSQGVYPLNAAADAGVQPELDALGVIRQIAQQRRSAWYVLLDVHPFLPQPLLVRTLKQLALDAPEQQRVILLSHALELPKELHPYSAQLSLALPPLAECRARIREFLYTQPEYARAVDLPLREALAQALVGFSERELSRLFERWVKLLLQPQTQVAVLNASAALRYQPNSWAWAEVAGLHSVKRWQEAQRLLGSQSPRAVLFSGLPGCGQTTALRATANAWERPLVRLDPQCTLSAEALVAQLASLGPVVLQLEPLEQYSPAFLSRVYQQINAAQLPIMLVACCHGLLADELLELVAADGHFFFDLPDRDSRAQLFVIHLQRRELGLGRFELMALADVGAGLTSAELERALVCGLYSCAQQGLDQLTLFRQLRRLTPWAEQHSEYAQHLRFWAMQRGAQVG